MQGKTAEEILAHPRFAEARRAHVDALVSCLPATASLQG